MQKNSKNLLIASLIILIGFVSIALYNYSSSNNRKIVNTIQTEFKNSTSLNIDNNNTNSEENLSMTDKDSQMKNETEMTNNNAAMTKEESNKIITMDGESKMSESPKIEILKGTYEIYSPEKLSLAENGKVLLFFHAPWCPICRVIESEINSNPNSITRGVHILKVDFDTSITLRQKYGVTVQHTFIEVNKDGGQIQKWSDSSRLSDVLNHVK